MKLEWLTNAYNPALPETKASYGYDHGESREVQWRNYIRWLEDKVIGDPQPTNQYDVESLKKFNIVGIYRRND